MSDRSSATGGEGSGATVSTGGERSATAGPSPTAVAQELLVATRTGQPTADLLATLGGFDDAALETVRTDRRAALAFWLNLYNAGTQLLLADEDDRYGSWLRQFRFFAADCLTVGGTPLSLDAIEHSILRRGMSKYGLGYLPRLRTGSFAKRYQPEAIDPRIHFALNCGAASCPAIRAYEPDAVDDQLDLATRTYLDATVEYDDAAGVAKVPRVFLWFRGDFGGKSGVRSFLAEYDAVPADSSISLSYLSWDWSREESKFAEES
jgi:hypothetical protein